MARHLEADMAPYIPRATEKVRGWGQDSQAEAEDTSTISGNPDVAEAGQGGGAS